MAWLTLLTVENFKWALLHNILTLTTGGFALSNGAHIKVYVDHIDITGLTSYRHVTELPITI
jgi:hypothetical protein